MAKKIAVVLSGCGVNDGSEIHESVITMLAIQENGASVAFFAPNIPQKKVVDHVTGEKICSEMRNVLVESARIARGEIKDIRELRVTEYEAVIFPGGFGAALNLCDFAEKGANCTVLAEIERVVKEFHSAKKPIGAICIAPGLVARVLGSQGITITIGNDEATASEIRKTGAKHQECEVDNIVVDDQHRIVSTPAYMLAENIAEAAAGIRKLVAAIIQMT